MKTNYNKPKLRERLKNKILKGSKAGKPNQWNARKAQLLKREYEKAGGGYKGPKSSSQKSLTKWTKEEWQTSDNKPAIRKGGTVRYLPKKAWDKLTPSQKKATNRKKKQASKKGKQFVSNTKVAKIASSSIRNKRNNKK